MHLTIPEPLRGHFSEACRGSAVGLAALPACFHEAAVAGNQRFRARSSRAGVNQDPLRIRARWFDSDRCINTLSKRILHAVAGTKPPECKCRYCRLARAAHRLALLRAGKLPPSLKGPGPSGASYSWRDVWAEIPEAALESPPPRFDTSKGGPHELA